MVTLALQLCKRCHFCHTGVLGFKKYKMQASNAEPSLITNSTKVTTYKKQIYTTSSNVYNFLYIYFFLILLIRANVSMVWSGNHFSFFLPHLSMHSCYGLDLYIKM